MADYLNHLTRMYEIAASGTNGASPYYFVQWKLYPNLAMDLIVPALSRWIDVETATRLFLFVAQALVVTGSIAIELAVKRRFAISGFVSLLFLFNAPFSWGFLNFEFATGVALWAIAAWLVVEDRAWTTRLVVHGSFVAVLFAAHMFALGIYGVTIGAHELWSAVNGPRSFRRLCGTVGLLVAPVIALLLIMAITGGSVGGGNVNVWRLAAKFVWPVSLLNGQNAFMSVIGTIVLGCLAYGMWSRKELVVRRSGAWIAGALSALYVCIPGTLLDTALVDVRVLAAAVFILPGFVSLDLTTVQRKRYVAAIVSGLIVVNVSLIERSWLSYQPIYGAMVASFSRLDPQSRVLVAHVNPSDDPPFTVLSDHPLHHAPTLAVHYARAFVPTLFTTVGKQPLQVSAGVSRLSFSCGGPISLAMLRAILANDPRADGAPPFVKHWANDFDYVYILGKVDANPIPDSLGRLVAEDDFSLFKVVHPPRSTGSVSASASP